MSRPDEKWMIQGQAIIALLVILLLILLAGCSHNIGEKLYYHNAGDHSVHTYSISDYTLPSGLLMYENFSKENCGRNGTWDSPFCIYRDGERAIQVCSTRQCTYIYDEDERQTKVLDRGVIREK